MFNNAYVLMTALVPTVGHAALIDFAQQITNGRVFVMVQGRSIEPVGLHQRTFALQHHYDFNVNNITIIGDHDDKAPQNPNETIPGADKAFWRYWTDRVEKQAKFNGVEIHKDDVFVASEPYGAIMAEKLGIHFMPFDMKREIHSVKGSDVRSDLVAHWDDILPEFKHMIQTNIVLFGQESVGKTTLAKALSKRLNHSVFIPEWARGYLEAVGTEITQEKMTAIEIGQSALEEMAHLNEAQFNFFDTDLLSTQGYYRIFEERMDDDVDGDYAAHPELDRRLNVEFMHYVLLRDDIPFEEDALRYGGDVRQSSYEFWKRLLDQYGAKYTEMPVGLTLEEKINYIADLAVRLQTEKFQPIKEFERE